MIAKVEKADGTYELREMGWPVCNEDFCDGCGDCLACQGHDDVDWCCRAGSSRWVIYLEDSRNPYGEGEDDERTPDRYVPDRSKPAAWVVDVDGTLALADGRSPYEYDRVGEDLPNEPVVALVGALIRNGYHIVVMSGREDSCRDETEEWLVRNLGGRGRPLHSALHMRATGDNREDSVVKIELFHEHVAPNWNVWGVLDDRDQVVAMWRSLGLFCCQVAPGSF